MSKFRIQCSANTCTFEIELTWEQAQGLLDFALPLLGELSTASKEREQEQQRSEVQGNELAIELATNKAKWAALAVEVEAEIKRRANGPDSRRSLIKQIAAERGMTAELLGSFLRVNRREARNTLRKSREYEAHKLRKEGCSQKKIAKILGVSTRWVGRLHSDVTAAPKETQLDPTPKTERLKRREQ
jgi:DNA-directed RNA polymerase specialized sigma subunit